MTDKHNRELNALPTYIAALYQASAYRNLHSFLTTQLAPFKLVPTEWSLLGQLYLAPHSRPSTLADALNITMPLCTRMVNALEERSIVSREILEKDKRGFLISLTPEGEHLVNQVEKTLRQEMRLFLSDVTMTDLATYIKVLHQLSSRIE